MVEMRFGRYPEVPFKMWWGARAIATGEELDIPYDRFSWEGGDRDSRQPLVDWINKEVLPFLNKKLSYLKQNQSEVLSLKSDDGKFCAEACCNDSYGYLYIGCWEVS